jgi:hypothetical protein
MMSVHEFRDEDAAYLKWTSQHGGGYTINIQRMLHPSKRTSAPGRLPHCFWQSPPQRTTDQPLQQGLR